MAFDLSSFNSGDSVFVDVDFRINSNLKYFEVYGAKLKFTLVK